MKSPISFYVVSSLLRCRGIYAIIFCNSPAYKKLALALSSVFLSGAIFLFTLSRKEGLQESVFYSSRQFSCIALLTSILFPLLDGRSGGRFLQIWRVFLTAVTRKGNNHKIKRVVYALF